ncbi:MAG: 3-phenylpropionate/trans-cinnamate dioxygenase ferredoxin reductase component [Frankiaceae bacterium]|jgi:3-phenylpropionate/trans-cinnamate dioxygenase ferredoxin reductase subunit|nr:3-phenylpropionate/trans-cinnamate dioxygenase ferredoxin reductase component [Frankiaceae bacterium]
MSRTFVVVGGGVGGGTAAFALRAAGFEGRIVLICDEPRPPYSKPPLSKGVLQGTEPVQRTAFRPDKWYVDKGIDLVTGVAVTELDADGHKLTLADGQLLGFDKLLLATGGTARSLPGVDAVDGVFTLRTVDDALAIKARLQAGARLVVVGAGFIGAEVAASARTVGCEVTVLEGMDSPLQRVLPKVLGELYGQFHREHGVEVRTGIAISDLERQGEQVVAHAASGERFVADAVVVGIGMVPNDSLAVKAGLAVDNGILVDETCATSAPDIFAAGDVANAYHPLFGERMRVEHWQHAQHQAKAAALNMAGTPTPYEEVPWVWSDQYDLNLQVAGLPQPDDDVHLRGDVDGRCFSAILTRNGAVTAAVAVNRADDVRAVRRMLQARATIPLEVLADPGTDLTGLVEETLNRKDGR